MIATASVSVSMRLAGSGVAAAAAGRENTIADRAQHQLYAMLEG